MRGRRLAWLVALSLAAAAPTWAQEAAPPAGPATGQGPGRPPRRTRISVPIHVSIAEIRADLQARIPKDQSGSGNGETICKAVFGLKLCVGTHYDYHVTRTGDVSVAPFGAGLRIGVPLRVTGHGGLRGPEAQALRLDARAFRAAADVSLLIGFKVKPDWCLETPVRIQYAWTEPPRVEIASGTSIDVEGLVRKMLDARLNATARKLSESIPCGEVQSALKRAWTVHVVPLRLPGVPDLALVIDPQSFGISDLAASAEDLKVVLSGDARTLLTTTPPPELVKGPLPPPAPVSSAPDRASLTVTVYAPYALMRSVALQAARPIPVSLGPLSGTLTLTDLMFRQVGPKLGVDIGYSVNGVTPSGPQAGTAHLEGVPSVAPDGRSITLKDATVSPESSIALGPALGAVLNEILRQMLSRTALVDLGPRLDAIERSLSGLGSAPSKTKGLRISVRDVKVRLGTIATGPDGLTGTALAEGDVALDLAALRTK